ncbi:MAG TPA: GPW/gp25 family protein [Longimicrobium sp.]|nr:GPW/gp25 family protein [Longimicrobium sp.]
MSSEFLGVGWAHPVRPKPPEAEKGIATAAYEDGIRDAVWLILGTAPGERVMRPDFGCAIHDAVFATTSATTLGGVVRDVTDALVRWEPRIEVLGVDAAPDPAEPARLLVHVDYRVRTTNNQFNLVYPFYLERSGA